MDAHRRPGVSFTVHHHTPNAPCLHLDVSWQAFIALIDELLLKVAQLTPRPTEVVGISFGGVLIARAISKILGIPASYAAAESFGHDPDDFHYRVDPQLDKTVFRYRLLRTVSEKDRKRQPVEPCVLVVDDHPGMTLKNCARWIEKSKNHGFNAKHVITASLWNFDRARLNPDLYVDWMHPVEIAGLERALMPQIQRPEQLLWPRGSLAEIARRVQNRGPLEGPPETWPGVTLSVVDDPKHGAMPLLDFSWEAYANLLDRHVLQVAQLAKQPNQIIGIFFGGSFQAYALSKVLSNDEREVPVAFIAAESYAAANEQEQREMLALGEPLFARDMAKKRVGLGEDPLIADDLVERGLTLERSITWLLENPEYGFGIATPIQTAVIFEKPDSGFKPTVSLVKLQPIMLPGLPGPRVPWVGLPWEGAGGYDTHVTLADIERRVALRDPSRS